MNTSFNQQGSARIYQFPVGGRAGLGGHRHDEIKTSELALSRVNQIAVGGAWYHDEAIQESKPVRER